VRAHVYHAPSLEDPIIRRTTKTPEIHQVQTGGDKELTRVGEGGALVGVCTPHSGVRKPWKSRLVAAEVEDHAEHPKGARDMHRLTGNHRSSLKKWPENRAWHNTKINPKHRLKLTNSKSSKGLEKNTFTSWFHREPPREKKVSSPWLSAGPKQTIKKQRTETKAKAGWSGASPLPPQPRIEEKGGS
jgi:hypothetical protein